MVTQQGFHAITDETPTTLEGAVEALLEASGFTHPITQVVELGSTSLTPAQHFDVGH